MGYYRRNLEVVDRGNERFIAFHLMNEWNVVRPHKLESMVSVSTPCQFGPNFQLVRMMYCGFGVFWACKQCV